MWLYSGVTQRSLGLQNLALSVRFSNSGLWQGNNLRSCYCTNKFAVCSGKLLLFPKNVDTFFLSHTESIELKKDDRKPIESMTV